MPSRQEPRVTSVPVLSCSNRNEMLAKCIFYSFSPLQLSSSDLPLQGSSLGHILPFSQPPACTTFLHLEPVNLWGRQKEKQSLQLFKKIINPFYSFIRCFFVHYSKRRSLQSGSSALNLRVSAEPVSPTLNFARVCLPQTMYGSLLQMIFILFSKYFIIIIIIINT